MATEVYNKPINVSIRAYGREERRGRVNVIIQHDRFSSLEGGKALVMRLTDDSDPFFLHTLRMTDEEFQQLKEQERFLIDFDAFPRQIMDFLDLCAHEESKRSPKYVAQLQVNGLNSEFPQRSRFEIVETSEFQHLTRLKLVMTPADDSEVKKYLAECLKLARQAKDQAEQQAEHMETEMRNRMQKLDENLRKKSHELEQLQAEWTTRTSAVQERFSDELVREREKSESTLREIQTKHDEERRSMETSCKRTVMKLEAKNYELEAVSKDLTEKRLRAETALQELRDRMGALEEELQRRNADIATQRRQVTEAQNQMRDLEAHRHEAEEVSRKHQEVVTRLQDRLSSSQEQLEKLEKTAEQKDAKITKIQKDYQLQAADLNKANDIIRKLQLDNRTVNEKLKLRSGIVVQQEAVLKDVKQQLENSKAEVARLNSALGEKEQEIASVNTSLSTLRADYAEAERSLENNANVITWLNRQLNPRNGKIYPSQTGTSLAPAFADLKLSKNRHEEPDTEESQDFAPYGVSANSTSPFLRSGATRKSISSSQPVQIHHLPRDGSRSEQAAVEPRHFQNSTNSRADMPTLKPVSALRSVSSSYFNS